MKEVTLEIAKQMMTCFSSVALFDKNGRYIYVSDNWVKNRDEKAENVIGKYAWEIVKDSKVEIVIKTHKPIYGEIIECKVGNALTFYWPLFNNNEFEGVLICSLTHGLENLFNINKKLKLVSDELENYKNQIELVHYTKYSINDIVGVSPAIKSLKEQIALAARFKSTVLIEGETGTGKELVAHSIHSLSDRRFGKLVRVNCSAIPTELMESEFFGYDEGAFTGAKKGGNIGKFELAESGSIFLDEINQLSLSMQPKLLRVLQENEIERVGGKSLVPIDVRVIVATNVALDKMVEKKKFRSDLFYRLNVLRIKVPPLRERKEDLSILSRNLVSKLNNQMGTSIKYIEDDVIKLFMDYDWPGNVRELQNVIENALTLSWGDTLELKHFDKFKERTIKQRVDSINLCENKSMLKDLRCELECQMVVNALKKCDGNKVEAAKFLGISRNSLYKKLHIYNLI